MYGNNVRRSGCVRTKSYNVAITKLQEMGFITELWVSKKGGLALRWYRCKEQWSVTSTGIASMSDQIENIGRHVCNWVACVEKGLGKETNYAVREV